MSVIDLATYSANFELNDSSLTSGLKRAENSTTSFQGKLGDLTGFMKTNVAAGIIAVSAALAAGATKLLEFMIKTDRALNNLQAQTGASTEQMAEFKKIAMDIFNTNLGKSIDDIAQAMIKVKQVTGATGEELKETTKNALLLRDVFGFEIKESINAVNTLMKQFGITAQQAYTIIAQGAQNGADKNGDLIDTLNEYAPQFAALGFSAEQFMDILIQGGQDGAWSIDKVGDAVKEFNIRAKDMSKTTKEAFTTLGLDADQMGKDFASGGTKAQEAFKKVLDGINSIEDPIKRNEVGVKLFGTQWEDLEAKSILALRNIKSAANGTANTLDDINKVQYNDAGSSLELLGKKILTSVVEPLETRLQPNLKKLNTDIANINLNPLVEVLNFMANHLPTIIGGLTGVGVAIKSWETITTIAGVVTTALGKIKEVATNLKTELEKFFTIDIPTALDNMAKSFSELPEKIKKWFDAVVQKVINWLADMGQKFSTEVPKLIDDFINFWITLPEKMLKIGRDIIDYLWNGIKEIWTKLESWVSEKVAWLMGKLAFWRSSQEEMSAGSGSSGGGDTPTYAQGTPWVPNTGLALIHKGEMIVPAQYNPFNGNNGAKTSTTSTSIDSSIRINTVNVPNVYDVSGFIRNLKQLNRR